MKNQFYALLTVILLFVSLNSEAQTNFYSAASGNLDVLASWGTVTDGSGANPSDFVTDGQIFNIQNNATPTIAGAWTVSGAGSKVIVGDGTNACTFTIPTGLLFTSVATDISNLGILKNQNASETATSYGTPAASFNVLNGGIYQQDCDGGTLPTATWNTGSNCNVTGVLGTIPGGMAQTFYNFLWDCASQSGFLSTATLPTGINGTCEFRRAGATNTQQINWTNGATTTWAGDMIVSIRFILLTSTTTNRTFTLRDLTITANSGGTPRFLTNNSALAVILNVRNLTITGSDFDFNGINTNATTVNVSGNFSQSGGRIIASSSGMNGTNSIINFSGTTQQDVNITGGTLVGLTGRHIRFLTLANSIVNFATPLAWSSNAFSDFTANANSTLMIPDVNGITSAVGTQTGSVRTVTTRTFNTTASYIYTGAASQITGTGLPATVKNLRLQNAVLITVPAKTVTGDLTVSNCIATITGALTVTGTTSMTGSAVTLSGGNIVANGNVVMNGTLVLPGASNTFTIGGAATLTTGTSFSATNMFKLDGTLTGGQLIKTYNASAATDFTFPVGTGSIYAGVRIDLTNGTTARNLGVHVINAADPNLAGAPNSIDRYWRFSDSQVGVNTYSYTGYFSYLGATISGSEALLKLNRWDGTSTWLQDEGSAAAGNLVTTSAGLATASGWALAGTNVDFTAMNTISPGGGNFYAASTGNLELLSSWGSNPDGTGSNPASFTSDGQAFYIRNNATPTLGDNWVVSGTGTNVVLGDGAAVCNFTIPAAFSYTGPMDINSNGTLTIQNATVPTLGILASGSTVNYASSSAQAIALTDYFNLTSSDAGDRTLPSGNVAITGTFTPGTNAYTTTGNTIEFKSTTAQTIPAFNYNNLTSSGTGTRTLASSGTVGVAGVFTPGSNAYTISGSIIDFNGPGSQTIPAFNYNSLTSSNSGARTLASSGTIGIAGAFTPGSNSYDVTGSTVSINATGPQSVSAFTFNNLTNNSSGGTISLTDAVNVGGTLTLTGGTITLGNFDLSVTNSATAAIAVTSPSSSKMIITNGTGQLIRAIVASSGTYLYPIGETTNYTPGSLNFSANSSLRNVGMIVVAGVYGHTLPSGYINRHWNTTDDGGTASCTYLSSFTYVAGDILGVETDMFPAVYNSSVWTQDNGTVGSGAITFATAQNDNLNNSSFTGKVDHITGYRSADTGDWNDIATWEVNIDGGGWVAASDFPTYSNCQSILIQNGSVVTVTADVTVDQVIFDNSVNSTIIVNSGVNLTLNDGAGNDLDFSTNSNARLTVDGTITSIGQIGGSTSATTSFNTGSTYIHQRDGGAIPSATWSSGSNCNITGIVGTQPSNMTQHFYNFLWDCPSQSGAISFAGNIPTGVDGTCEFRRIGAIAQCNLFSGDGVTRTWTGDLVVSANKIIVCTSGTTTTTFTVRDVYVTTTYGANTRLLLTNMSATTNFFTFNCRNLSVNGGIVDFNAIQANNCNMNVSGNVTMVNGSIYNSNNLTAGTSAFNFTGTTQQDVNFSGTTLISGKVACCGGNPDRVLAFTASANSIVNFVTPFTCGAGVNVSFTVASGATIIIPDVNGITSGAGASTGSVRVPSTGSSTSFSTGASYRYTGISTQITGTALPATVNNLTLSNAVGITVPAETVNGTLTVTNCIATVTGSITVAGVSTLSGSQVTLNGGNISANGNITMDGSIVKLINNNFSIGGTATLSTGTSFSSTNMFVTNGTGSLIKIFNAAGAFTYPIGDVSPAYSPLTFTHTAGTFVAGTSSLRARVTADKESNITSSDYVNRYWTLTDNIAGGTGDATFQYLQGDIVGDENNIYGARFVGIFLEGYGLVDAGNHRMTANAITDFTTADFTGGQAPPIVDCYQSHQSGNWSDLNTWEVQVNCTGSWIYPASTAPTTLNSSSILIRNGNNVTVSADVSIDQVTFDDDAGNSTITVNSGVNLTISDEPGNDIEFSTNTNARLIVNGNINNQGQINLSGATSGQLIVNGTGIVTNTGTLTGCAAANTTINGTYIHQQDGGTIPLAAWNTSSNCNVTGIIGTAPANMSQNFYNFLWDNASQAGVINFGSANFPTGINGTCEFRRIGNPSQCNFDCGNRTWTGDLIVSANKILVMTSAGGTFSITLRDLYINNSYGTLSRFVMNNSANTFTLNIRNLTVTGGGYFDYNGINSNNTTVNMTGNLTLTNGTIYNSNNNTAGTSAFNFSGTTQQNINISGTSLISGLAACCFGNPDRFLTFNANNSSIVNFVTPFACGSGVNVTFTAASGSTLMIPDMNGITSGAGQSTGSVRVPITGSSVSFSTGASYIYNGSASQITGTALPATVNNFTVNNSSGSSTGVTLTNSLTVNGALSLNNGLLTLGTKNLTLPAAGILAGTPSVSAMIVAGGSGQFIRGIGIISSNTSILFPVGDATPNYAPVNLVFSSNSTAGTIGLKVVNSTETNNDNPSAPAAYLSRYWIFSNATLTNYTYTGTFIYPAVNISGAETDLKLSRWTGAAWFEHSGSSAAANTLSISSDLDQGTAPLTGDFTGRGQEPSNNFSFTVTAFLQGYYLGGTMSPLLYMLGSTGTPTDVDYVTVELHNADHSLAYSTMNITILQTDGTISCTFNGAAVEGTYYIVVKHRSSISVWSSSEVGVTDHGSYSFAGNSGANAFSSNLANLGSGVYGLYDGDINSSGAIDYSDLSQLNAALSFFTVGVYDFNDITGDGSVDEDDYRLMQNNVPLGIYEQQP